MTDDLISDGDVVVVGGGQSALAIGYYLRRASLSYAILDDARAPGGAWQHTWASLRLFSPAQWSSLPGRLMPGGTAYYPTRDEALAYLADYEARYALPIVRPVRVSSVQRAGERFRVVADTGVWIARAVVSATGTWAAPNVPRVADQHSFAGRIVHSARYESPNEFDGQRVVVVGGGNSGAQIVADLASSATVTWATRRPPTFLPDDIDGRYLFGEATARYRALTEGAAPPPPRLLRNIVMVESVRRARESGALNAVPMFTSFTETACCGLMAAAPGRMSSSSPRDSGRRSITSRRSTWWDVTGGSRCGGHTRCASRASGWSATANGRVTPPRRSLASGVRRARRSRRSGTHSVPLADS